MHDIEQLEHDWKRYKRRQRLPYYTSAATVVFVTAAIYYWMQSQPISSTVSKATPRKSIESKNAHISVPQATVNEKKIVQTTPHDTHDKNDTKKVVAKMASEKKHTNEEVDEPSVVLNPATDFLGDFDTMQGSTAGSTKQVHQDVQYPVKEETLFTASNHSIDPNKKTVKARKNTDHTPSTTQETPIQKPKTASSLTIHTKQTNSTLVYLIKRFNQTRDPKLATYIAQSFFKKGNYEQTIKWSVIANSIEPANEASWMLFAKAKVKLGQKEDAINALKIYLNQYSSRKVKSYLDSLEGEL